MSTDPATPGAHRRTRGDDGASLTEYALIVVLVAIACLTAVSLFSAGFQAVGNRMLADVGTPTTASTTTSTTAPATTTTTTAPSTTTTTTPTTTTTTCRRHCR